MGLPLGAFTANLAGAAPRLRKSPYLPGDNEDESSPLDSVSSASPYSPARSRTGGATAVSAGAGANPTGAYAPHPSDFGTSGAGNPAPNIIRDVYAPELQEAATKLQSAYAAPRPGMARQVLGALLSRRNPAIGGLVSGETQRQRAIEPLQQQYGLVSSQIAATRAANTADLQNANIGSEIAERSGKLAETARHNVATENIKAEPPPKPTADEQTFEDLVSGGMSKLDALEKIKNVKDPAAKAPDDKDKAISDYLTGTGLADTPKNRDRARSVLATRDRPGKDPDIAEMGKTLKQLQIEEARKKLAAAGKPTGQESNRADLARNLNENLDSFEDIVKRRPELFGPLAGRATDARIASGFFTDDADIGKLANIKHQMGMAQISAHGMRSAQGIEGAANALANFHNHPEGIKGAIKSARDSVKTFTQDAENAKAAGATPSRNASANAKDPLGIR